MIDARDQVEAWKLCLMMSATCVWRGRLHVGAVTFSPDGKWFTVEHGDEIVARLIGFEVGGQECRYPIWWGTGETQGGMFAAQFEITEDDE